MTKNLMKLDGCRVLLLMIIACGSLGGEGVRAVDTDQSNTTQAKEEFKIDSSVCSKEVLLKFFPQPVVKYVLLKNNIPEEQANAIAKELSRKNIDMDTTVKERSLAIHTDFKELSQRDIGIKMYREALYEIFSTVLKGHGIEDEDRIQAFLDDIQEIKGKMFVECIKKEQPTSKLEF